MTDADGILHFLSHVSYLTEPRLTSLYIRVFCRKVCQAKCFIKKLYYKAHLTQTFFSRRFMVNYEFVLYFTIEFTAEDIL